MSKKFSDIVAELASVSKVSPAKLDEARLAFSELATVDQDKALGEMKAIEAKFSEDASEETSESTTETSETSSESTETTQETTQETTTETSTETTTTETTQTTVQASEQDAQKEAVIFAETGMTSEQIKNMQKSFSEMAHKQKLADLEKSVSTMVFSEANKTGKILPKSKEALVTLLAQFSEPQQKAVLEFLKGNNFAGKAVEFGEKGASGESKVFNLPSSIPNNVDRESYILANLATQFKEQDASLSLEQATLKAHEYMKANSIK